MGLLSIQIFLAWMPYLFLTIFKITQSETSKILSERFKVYLKQLPGKNRQNFFPELWDKKYDSKKVVPSTCLLFWGSLNSALNPIAYSMTNREFRKFAFRLICTGGDQRRIKDFTCASSLAYTPTSGLENKSRELHELKDRQDFYFNSRFAHLRKDCQSYNNKII